MASAGLIEELTCSFCLSIYTDPVILTCGHSFCRVCIGDALDTQEEGRYSCPECRESFRTRPELRRSLRLSNIARSLFDTEPVLTMAGISCSYCINSPVPASKTCLLCEASLCDEHLRVHSKSAEHVLTEPTTSTDKRKCSVHREILKYYCTEDAVCICVSCSLAGEHRGHQVETLNEASEKKKEKLRNVLAKLTSKREETEKRVQSLQERRREVQNKAAGETERVAALIRDIRGQLEALEKRVLSEISRQEEQVLLRALDLIQQLELKKEGLSRKIHDIEELCNMADSLTVLQQQDFCDEDELHSEEEEDRDIDDRKLRAVDLDEGLISVILHAGLAGILTAAKRRLDAPKASDILLDVNTAGNRVDVSGDFKTASRSKINQGRPETPERFQDYPQVLSTRSFSSGRHYWGVEGIESGVWVVGMAYPSIDRRGCQSWIGYNKKSWGLRKWSGDQYLVRHDSKVIQLPHRPSCQRLGIFLDYEAGRLSFYELCDPVRHLHTFTATFTEPLHAAFEVWSKSWVKIWSWD